MCSLRANIVTNCRKCKSSVRHNCIYRKKTSRKTFVTARKKQDV